MNKLPKLIIFIFLFAASCSTSYQVIKNGSQNIYISYWDNGRVKQMRPVQNGQTHGLVESFYEDGTLLSVVPYHLGVPHGTVRLYTPEGKLENEISYIAGKVHGPVISFYEDGTPRTSLPYFQDQLYGEGYEYFESGMVSVSTMYSNWTRHGEQIVYNQEGWPLFETPYRYGIDLGYSNIINYKHKRMSPLFSQQRVLALEKILSSKEKHELTWPVMGGGLITYNFGMRTHPVTGVHQLHKGVDIAYVGNQPILAAEEGMVIHADWYGGYGKTVKLTHDQDTNFVTLYAHLSEILVQPGDQIRKGQLIGYMGRTGKVTGIHLHFEVRISNVAVDPMLYFRQTKHMMVKK